MLPASCTFDLHERDFRSFYTGNIGSVCQRAAKLPSVKL